MRIFRALLPVLVFGIMVLIPQAAFAATTATFFGPIIPEECHCDTETNGGVPSAPDYGCVLAVVQNALNFAVSLSMIVLTLSLAYLGFMYMKSSFSDSAGDRAKARTTIQNIILGVLVMLSAWLMVDYVMKYLYNPDAANFGPWESILAVHDAPYCLAVHQPPGLPGGSDNGGQGDTGTGTGTATTTPGGTATTTPSTGTGANCPAADPSTVVAFSSSVTVGETERATPETVQQFLAMRTEALKVGIDLKVVDGYRSDAEQVQLWNQYCSSGTCSRAVAKPCSLGGTGSNHNSGRALDLNVGCSNGDSSCNTPAYNWLKEHGMQWGFRNAIPTDPVHWSPSGR